MAVYLWIASLVVGAVGIVTSFGSIGPQVRAELNAQLATNPDLGSVDPETLVRVATYAVVVVSVLGIALRIFLLVKLAAGRRWARTVLTVLGALSVVAAVVGVRSSSPIDAALSVVNALLIAAAIVYMFSDGAKSFFAPAARG